MRKLLEVWYSTSKNHLAFLFFNAFRNAKREKEFLHIGFNISAQRSGQTTIMSRSIGTSLRWLWLAESCGVLSAGSPIPCTFRVRQCTTNWGQSLTWELRVICVSWNYRAFTFSNRHRFLACQRSTCRCWSDRYQVSWKLKVGSISFQNKRTKNAPDFQICKSEAVLMRLLWTDRF